MLIPVGSWCRTAYQVGEFKRVRGSERISYPFDWTITSFKALQTILGEGFEPESILPEADARISPFGSVTDSSTDLIFHHDLLPSFVSRFSEKALRDGSLVPEGILRSEEYSKGKARFIHTYSNLKEAVNRSLNKGEKIGFVRWNRFGHPEKQLAHAFEGESVESLWNLLSSFANSPEVAVLQVVTVPEQAAVISDDQRVISYERSKQGARVEIRERLGFDGDGTNNFQGDTRSWSLAIERFISDFNIALD